MPPCSPLSLYPFCERAKLELIGYTDALMSTYELNFFKLQSSYVDIIDINIKCLRGANPDYFIYAQGSIYHTVLFWITVVLSGLAILSIILTVIFMFAC